MVKSIARPLDDAINRARGNKCARGTNVIYFLLILKLTQPDLDIFDINKFVHLEKNMKYLQT